MDITTISGKFIEEGEIWFVTNPEWDMFHDDDDDDDDNNNNNNNNDDNESSRSGSASISSRGGSSGPDIITISPEEALSRHQGYLRVAMSRHADKWTHTPIEENSDRRILTHKTASEISYKYLTPMVYRSMKDLQSTASVAAMLGISVTDYDTYMHPGIGVIQKALDSRTVRAHARNLGSLGFASSETEVETAIMGLIYAISFTMDRYCLKCYENTKFATGGILADGNYAICGVTDSCFKSSNDQKLLALEVNTMAAWPVGDLCNRNTRFTQAIASLFYTGVPTFLITQQQFKLLVLSPYGKREIYQYPPNLAHTGPIAASLVTCIALCILASTAESEPATSPFKDPDPWISEEVTSAYKGISNDTKKVLPEPTRRSSRLADKYSATNGAGAQRLNVCVEVDLTDSVSDLDEDENMSL